MSLPNLKELKNDIYYCIRCGFCRSVCPVVSEKDMEESSGPRGRMILIRGLITREIKPSSRVTEKMYMCTGCAYCRLKCPPGLEVDNIVLAARRDLFSLGLPIPEGHLEVLSSLKSNGNPFSRPRGERNKWMEGFEGLAGTMSKPSVLYWVGCTTSYTAPNIASSMARILSRAGVSFKTLGASENCCGYPYLLIGDEKSFRENAGRVVEQISREGVETVVVNCPGCYRAFIELYPKYLGALPFKALHSSQLIDSLIRNGMVKPSKPVNLRVTYHDPCDLGRHLGVYDPPRSVISSIPGVTLIEMEKSRGDARCCGGGGALRLAFPEVSTNIGTTRIRLDVAPLNVDAIVTACPTCVRNLKDGVTIAEAMYDVRRVEVLDLVELVDKAMGCRDV